ncbi:MAG: PSD1 and planctomycete cytochrome C domain-containing protein [Planctomycetota bacterium]
MNSKQITTSALRFTATAAAWFAFIPLLRADEIQFNRDIRPILAANCLECHGFDVKTRKAELRLDTFEGATEDHHGTVAIKPGDISSSELVNRILTHDPATIMPPPETRKSLKPAEKELLQRWIQQGAQYQKHWAFEPPVRSEVPATHDDQWVRTPVDAFIRETLSRHALAPRPDAGREMLIRRVALTLTGLPPTVAEVDAFLADTSDDAYEKMVDRYLASPRFGEEQARYWLDVARYADTHGLHLDNEREMWVYRDWVISAFNQNLPFDQFTTWQLAGDLLPNPTIEQKVATGFNRCNVTTSEGGAIADEWLYRYAVDRTSTAMQTWMGLTAGCAVCHDHKYDPVTTKDFYSMYAFFYSTSDPAMDGNIRNTTPFLKAPSAEQKLALENAQSAESAARRKLEESLAAITWSDPASNDAREVTDVIFDDAFPTGSRSRNTSRDNAVWPWHPEFGSKSGQRVLQLAYGGDYDLSLDLALIPILTRAEGHLEFWLRIDPYATPGKLSFSLNDGRNHRAVWGEKSGVGGRADLDMGPIPAPGEWVRIVIPFDKVGATTGSRIQSISFAIDRGKIFVDDMKVVGKTAPNQDPRSSFQQWWAISKGSNPSAIEGDLRNLLIGGPVDHASTEQKQSLTRFWMTHIQRPVESPIAEHRNAYDSSVLTTIAINESIPGTFIFTDLEKPRDAFVMLRGQYDKPGEKVDPNVPAAFPPLRDENGRLISGSRRPDRRDLARWFLSDENPLTARVTVNRIWQQVFGTGLVKSSDDFGTRGDLPSHPEILEWLALHFRYNGCDTKYLYRLLLTSSVFRQSSEIGDELAQRDPENRWLAHGPRFRLDAEQLRDNALYVSGLMDLTMGGKGVLPYQPDDIWEPVGYENSNTRFYMQDHGTSLYRRSVYCFLKRTAPPPFMSNFDGSNREHFCTRRERSNTPLQALQLMNDVQHFEAARALAERIIIEGGSSADQRIDFLFRTVLARHPESDEVRLVRDAFEKQLALFEEIPSDADQTIRTGESVPRHVASAAETAAWSMVANLILNLDESVVRN